MANQGLIIRNLRTLAGLSVRATSQRIGRSVGWLSEMENARGTARISEDEFNRIVELLDGATHRAHFKIWVANHKNRERSNKAFEGASLKFIRDKKGLSLSAAADATHLSPGYLSKLETGLKPITLEMRNRLMTAYGYSPSSFKNLCTDPVRSKVVPLVFKLKILLNQLSEPQIESVFHYIQDLTSQKVNSK